MSDGRGPRGNATGALAGAYPNNVAQGTPLLMGLAFSDDFIAVDSGQYGENNWGITVSGSATITTVVPTHSSGHEAGLRRLQVTSSGSRVVLGMGTGLDPFKDVPEGAVFACKLRHNSSTSDATLWAGLSESTNVPGSGLFVDFVGLRNEGGNWFGVCRNGTNETTVDLNVAASVLDTEYLIAGFLRAADGYRFWVADASIRDVSPTVVHFDPIDSNLPNEPLTPVIGIQSSAAGTKGLVVDWYELGGRTKRG